MSTLDIAASEHYFIFDGTPSYDFKCLAFPGDIDTSPVKDYRAEAIPGRNGDILIDNRRFENVAMEYDCIIYEDFDENFANLRSFLLSRNGYCRLSDTAHTDEFYHAYFNEAVTPVIFRDRSIGKFTLRFTRKPQRWLVDGENTVTIRQNNSYVDGGLLKNPTSFPCYPLIYLFGLLTTPGAKTLCMCNGTSGDESYGTKINFYNGDFPTDIKAAIDTCGLYIDMESMMVYNAQSRGGSSIPVLYNCNKYATYKIGDDCTAPYMLAPGDNSFVASESTGGNFMEIKVKPRWFRL